MTTNLGRPSRRLHYAPSFDGSLPIPVSTFLAQPSNARGRLSTGGSLTLSQQTSAPWPRLSPYRAPSAPSLSHNFPIAKL
jgi:hypothetical protein